MKKIMKMIKILLLALSVILMSGCVTKNYTTLIKQKPTYTISSGKIVKVDNKRGMIVASIEIDEIWNEGHVKHRDSTMFDPFFLLNGNLIKGKITDTLHRSYTYAKTHQVNRPLNQFGNNLKVALVGRALDNPKKEIPLPIKNKLIQGNTITIYVDKNIFSSNADKDILLKVDLLNQKNKTFDIYQVKGYDYKTMRLKYSLELVVKSSTGFMY